MTEPAFHPLDQDVFEAPRSSKAAARAARRAEKANKELGKQVKPLVAKNETQQDYIDILRDKESVFALGPAGVGKTYIPARIAAQMIQQGIVGKIIVSRVTVSSPRHQIGFLPGNIDAKMKPWMTPVIEGIRAEVSGALFDKWKGEGLFEIVPFEYMRGRTFENCFIILDEAQNATYDDLKLFLTRIGEGSQMVICGDPMQIDIPNSGLETVADLAERFDIMDVVAFSEEDVVRSRLAKDWVRAFTAHQRETSQEEKLDKSMPNFITRPPHKAH